MRATVIASSILIWAFTTALGQRQIPVFKTPQDSAKYSSVMRELSRTSGLISTASDAERESLIRLRDSLMTTQMTLINSAVVRFRTVYEPDPTLTAYKDFLKEPKPARVRTLTITGTNRKALPDSLFLCINLETLELVNWKLDRIPRRIKELKNLKEITLLNNQPATALRLPRNKTVKELNFRGENGDARLPRNFRHFRSLETLDVSRNQLTAFPNLKGCRNLKKLAANINEITLQDLRTRQPKSLTEINLSNNKIRQVPASIASFRSLKKLNLNNNQIEHVSEQISSLKQLEELSFYKNKLQNIPEPLYTMPSLKVIDLYFNEIEQADARIGQMQNLEVLYLANNKVFRLPDNLGQMIRLRELYIHHNRLSTLPESLGNLPDLSVLRVNDNSLLEFPMFLMRLQKLQNLDISHNSLTSLPTNDFMLKNLRILAIVGNPWNEETKKILPEFAQQLRTNYKTVVHLNTYEDQVE